MEESLRKLTILHSNDIHGCFDEVKDDNGKCKSGLAQVAGYVNKVKEEEGNAVYLIAGDVCQGSLIDSDFVGLSTVDILNMLPLDIMSIGNHELDYGISHLLFLEKCANFKLINANFKIMHNGVQMFKPYQIKDVNGIKILFIGLITPNIVDQTRAEELVGRFVRVVDAKSEVERIIHHVTQTKGRAVDLVVLMTHIGYEADIELAESLGTDSGVDIIVGAHSHTLLKEPTVVNDIIIVQAGLNNEYIGRLDLKVDTDNNRVAEYKWQTIPVDEEHCPTDYMVRAMVKTYVMDVDEKYSKFVTRLNRPLDNYGRGNTTEFGQLIADCFCDALGLDVMLLASSSTRCYEMERTVTLKTLKESYPYDGKIYQLKLSGKQLKKMMKYALRDAVLDKWAETFYHTSRDLHIVYNKSSKEIEMYYKGEALADDMILNVGIQEFYLTNSTVGFGMTVEELEENGAKEVISVSAFETLAVYLSKHRKLGGKIDDRLTIIK